MQTHDDNQHIRQAFLDELMQRANRDKDKSQITAGSEDEPVLAKWKHKQMHVVHRPDDPQGIARISVGGGNHLPVPLNYCTIRGKVSECIALLEQAIAALKKSPE